VKDVLDELDAWTARGDRVALATVVDFTRSAPRPVGTKMAIGDGGEIAGAVSGGCVEGAVVAEADAVLHGGPPKLLHYGIADEEAWEVGLPCGGEIDVWVERYAHGAGDPHAAFARLAREGGRGALVTVLAGPLPGARMLVGADRATTGSLGSAGLDAVGVEVAEAAMWAERPHRHTVGAVDLFVDVAFPPPRLVVFGAVDVAAALCRLARATGWRPFVVDPRTRFAQRERFPDAEEVVAAWPEEAFSRIGAIDRATAIAVLTHDPKLDDAALVTALRSDAAYIGAMGSRRAQARRRERLLALGIAEDELARIAAPIGLDLGGITAEETALSILAELVAVRHGHDGGRLSRAAGPIHEARA
jgi:xanthine dehydrogenase accessory factor